MFKMIFKWIGSAIGKWLDKEDEKAKYAESTPISVSSSWHGSNSAIGNSMHSAKSVGSSSLADQSRGMHFSVFTATGGKVVQLTTYNSHTDKSSTALYVVTDNEDLGEELNMIICKESLTR